MLGFPGGPVVKNLPANAGDTGNVSSILGLGRSTGVGNGNPLQYSPLENSGQRSLASYRPWGRKELDIPEHAGMSTAAIKKRMKFCHL